MGKRLFYPTASRLPPNPIWEYGETFVARQFDNGDRRHYGSSQVKVIQYVEVYGEQIEVSWYIGKARKSCK